MKTIKFLSIIFACLIIESSASAQKVKTESFKVSGECGMCKKKIENAAKQAGATYASWSPKTKVLKVTYSVTGSNVASIQQTIANTGYDTPGYKAPEDAYNSLDECCQYAREIKSVKCCNGEKCSDDKMKMKEGKCADMAACKDKDCCKKS